LRGTACLVYAGGAGRRFVPDRLRSRADRRETALGWRAELSMPRIWIVMMAILVACLLASIVIATIKLT